jgi:NCS1 family nucleobase:cation symporter-1
MRTPDSELWNEDLAPTSEAQRTWRWRHFAALWLGMVICVPAYMLASGLIEQGMSAGQAVLTVLLGNLVVLVPMLLIGHAGARWKARPCRCWASASASFSHSSPSGASSCCSSPRG